MMSYMIQLDIQSHYYLGIDLYTMCRTGSLQALSTCFDIKCVKKSKIIQYHSCYVMGSIPAATLNC